MKTAHNLGLAYVWDKQYEQGLVYLQEGIALTQQIGDRMKEGMFQKTIGACYFFQQQHQEAIRHYLIAHEIFVETGNRNWQGTVSHDLAEAYAEVGNDVEMKRYFAQAQKIVEELGQKQLLEETQAPIGNNSRSYGVKIISCIDFDSSSISKNRGSKS